MQLLCPIKSDTVQIFEYLHMGENSFICLIQTYHHIVLILLACLRGTHVYIFVGENMLELKCKLCNLNLPY